MNIISVLKEEQKEYRLLLQEDVQDNSGASMVPAPGTSASSQTLFPTSYPRGGKKLILKKLQQGSMERTIELIRMQQEMEARLLAKQQGQPNPQMEAFNIKQTIRSLKNAAAGLAIATSAIGAGKSQTPPTPPPTASEKINGELTDKDLVDVGPISGKMTETNPRQWYYGRAQLDPDAAEAFKKADADYFKETGKHININSAYRSRQHQAALSGKHPVVAKPGHSQHGLGRAIDVQPGSPEFEWLKKNGAKYGWDWKKIKNDPCHFGFCGTPKQTTDGKTQPAATTAPQEPKETITPDKKKTIKDLKDKTAGTSSTENKST